MLSHSAYDDYYLKATRIRALVAHDFAAAFAHGVDALLTPTATAFPPLLEEGRAALDATADYANDVMTIPASLAGVPAISVPAAQRSASGLPMGLQLIGRRLHERELLVIARALELARHH